jgi:hypothetical protein
VREACESALNEARSTEKIHCVTESRLLLGLMLMRDLHRKFTRMIQLVI